MNPKELPVLQSDIRQIDGTPVGVINAPTGYIVTNTLGELWVRQPVADYTAVGSWLKATLT